MSIVELDSIAIPGFIRPREHDQQTLYDGEGISARLGTIFGHHSSPSPPPPHPHPPQHHDARPFESGLNPESPVFTLDKLEHGIQTTFQSSDDASVSNYRHDPTPAATAEQTAPRTDGSYQFSPVEEPSHAVRSSVTTNGTQPPQTTSRRKKSFHTRLGSQTALSETVVQAPLEYIQSMPGKKVRERAAQAFNVWLKVYDHDLCKITYIIDLLHNASLILDDVEDGSIRRRGRPPAHLIFGTPQAVNSTGFQINRALEQVIKLGDPRCLDIFREEMEKLYVGQGCDLYWSFNNECPTYDDYISMVDYKTGALFKMLIKLMYTKSHNSNANAEDLYSLVTLLGRYFQIRDDYMNLTSNEFLTGMITDAKVQKYAGQKGFCDDLDEGKFSLILIHALTNSTMADKSILKHILMQRSKMNGMDLAQKHEVCDIFKRAGSLEFAVIILKDIGEEIERQVTNLEAVTGTENKPLRGLLTILQIT